MSARSASTTSLTRASSMKALAARAPPAMKKAAPKPKAKAKGKAKAKSAKKKVIKKVVKLPKAKFRGLKGFKASSGSSIFGGKLDKGVAGANGALASKGIAVADLSCRLVHVDAATGSDKYYVLQGIEDTSDKAKGRKDGKRFYTFQRWGRTGTGGNSRLQGPLKKEKVEQMLHTAFEAKTGKTWGSLSPGDAVASGKYWVAPAAAAAAGDAVREGVAGAPRWEYYIDDGVDGKADGWYEYTKDGAGTAEELHVEFKASGENPSGRRFVESGHFKYQLDFDEMTQTNSLTKKVRKIRRATGSTSRS